MVMRDRQMDQTSMHSQVESTTTMNTSISEEEEEDSSGSSDPHNILHDGQRKRKPDEADDERELKRRKNREAAKRCRDKKQKQTEDLKFKNFELEKENCQLAKQRDELIRKCRDYQCEIEQHKQQGCVVPHFNPPYNLDHLLQPSSPPSPSISESAPSSSSCPSPNPSISPGPLARYPSSASADLCQLPVQDAQSSGDFNVHTQDISKGPTSNTVASEPLSTSLDTTQCTSDSNKLHYLRVRNKDGSHKILCLDHRNYVKVMHKLRNQRAAAARNERSEQVQSSTSASDDASNGQSQQIHFRQEQSEPPTRIKADMINTPIFSQVEEQEASPNSGQKLDTCEDLLSILKAHVKDTGNGYELTPVSEDVVPIKQELLDAEYEQSGLLDFNRQAEMRGIKQEDTMMPESEGTWTTTGQQIRASLDTLSSQDMTSPSSCIQNIVQYLEGDEHTVSGSHTVQKPSQRAMQKQNMHSSDKGPPHMSTYVTSSASMGALSKMNAGISHPVLQQSDKQHVSSQITAQQQSGGQQQNIVAPSMQAVKLQSKTSRLVNSASGTFSGKLKTGLAAHSAGHEALKTNAAATSKSDVTSSISMTTEKQLQPITARSSRQITQKLRMQIMPGQHLSTSPSLIGPQQDSTTFSQDHPPSSTIDSSAIALVQLQGPTSDNLMSESTSQIAEYLKKNSIETLDF